MMKKKYFAVMILQAVFFLVGLLFFVNLSVPSASADCEDDRGTCKQPCYAAVDYACLDRCDAAFTRCVAGATSGSQSSDFGLGSVAAKVGLSRAEPEVIIGRVIQTLLGFVGLIAFILVIYAGFLWMTAGGSEEKVKKAKEILRNAVIGMAIVFSSYAITEFVLRQITQGTTGQP